MSDIDLDEFNAPERPDFRRVGRGVPFVLPRDGGHNGLGILAHRMRARFSMMNRT